MKINMLVNSKGGFYSSIALLKEKKLSMNLESLQKYAVDCGIELNVMKFTDIDFYNNNYSGEYFLYTSSEDDLLFYKGYIEDIILGLKLQGAILIPDFYLFRAHHNKVFMEIQRDLLLKDLDTGIASKYFGTLEDLLQKADGMTLPVVIKTATGAGSYGVALARTKHEMIEKTKKISKTFFLKRYIKNMIGYFNPYSLYSNKFVIQNFIEGLTGDYKVLVFGEKMYLMGRDNRKGDFRASGGGLFNYNPEIPEGIFDFARRIFIKLNTPIVSLDIACYKDSFVLIEFQALNFGTIALENSNCYYTKEGNDWVKIEAKSILEKEFIIAIQQFIRKN